MTALGPYRFSWLPLPLLLTAGCAADIASMQQRIAVCGSEDVGAQAAALTDAAAAPAPGEGVGVVQSAIYRGSRFPPEGFGLAPEHVNAIAHIDTLGQNCTGTLINAHWIVTARHCFESKDKRIAPGFEPGSIEVCFGHGPNGECTSTTDRADAPNLPEVGQGVLGRLRATNLIFRNDSDVALVEIPFIPHLNDGGRILPVGIPVEAPPMAEGTLLVAGGRGSQNGSGGTTENEFGEKVPKYPPRGLGELRFSNQVIRELRWDFAEIRAEAQINSGAFAQGPCGGDSGGPLFAQDRQGQARLVGVLDRGNEKTCLATEATPHVWTLIHQRRCWIYDFTGDLTPVDP